MDIFVVISSVVVPFEAGKGCRPVCYSPFSRFNLFPVGGRSTAIKLSNGDVWVLASTPLDEPTKTKLGELGPVKCVAA